MATASQRKKILSIDMRAVDKMSPALRLAVRGLRILKRVGVASLRAVRFAANALGRAFKLMLGPIAILTSALGVFAFARMIRGAALAGDAIAKMSKRIGFSTTALSEWSHVAQISGTDLETLEKAVKRMQKTIIDLELDLSTAVDGFELLGLTLADVAGKSPEQQFLILIEALAGVEDMTRRAGIAQTVFGRAGTKLLPILSEGAEGIRKLREEAHRLGLVFDTEAAVRSEKMVDATTRLRSALVGLRNTIAIELFPVFTEWTEAIANWLVENRGSIKQSATEWAIWARKLGASIRFVAGAVGAFRTMMAELVGDPQAAEVLGRVFRLIADLALSIARETTIAVVKLIWNTVQIMLSPAVTLFKTLGETLGGSVIQGFLEQLIQLPLKAIRALSSAIASIIESVPGAKSLFSPSGPLGFLNPQVVDIGLSGLAAVISANLSNILDDTEAKVTSVDAFIGRSVQNLINFIAQQMRDSGAAISTAIDGITEEFKDFLEGMEALAKDHPAIAAELKGLEAELLAVKAAADQMTEGLEAVAQEAAIATNNVADLPIADLLSPEAIERSDRLIRDAETSRLRRRARAAQELINSFDDELAGYQKMLDGMQISEDAFLRWRGAAWQNLQDKLRTLNGSFLDGAAAAAQDYVDRLSHDFAQGANAAAEVFSILDRGFGETIDALIDGTKRFGQVWEDIGRDILKLLAKIAAQQTALALTRFFFPGFGFAHGAVFEHGKVQHFRRGGVVNRPTIFPMRRGLGLMGEAGPEGVLPLRRLPGGDLGVQAVGAGVQPVNVTFEIHTVDTRGFQQLLTEESPLIEDLIRRAMASRRDFREQIRAIR